ncbi:MAG: ABC transporter permease [Candidatus Aminicenantes bacterium]|nr:ABC transporter permease [Candidatus Aminicenantes bacterium]
MGKRFHRPPRIPSWVLRRFIPESDNTFLSGDFDEVYNNILEKRGRTAARRWYWIQLLCWIPLILWNSMRWSMTMFKNYLKITLRNLRRQKAYSLINIAGLSVGIACAMLIFLVVRYEFTYECFHENADRIFRINIEHTKLERNYSSRYSPVPLAPAMCEEIPEVTHFARIAELRQIQVAYGDRKFYEENVRFVDPGILEMFTFPLIAGDKNTALSDLHSIVITEEMAVKYFGKEDPLGKTLVLLNRMPLWVKGVIKNHPASTNIHPDFLVPLENLRALFDDNFFDNWVSQQLFSFVMLAEGASAAEAEAKIQHAFNRHVRQDDGRLLSLDRLNRMHLFSDTAPTGNIDSLVILLAVGGLILLIACINFMNLATARSAKRAREVGLRKVVGAAKRQLIRQFIGESLIYTAISMVLALFLVHVFLPVLNGLTGQSLVLSQIYQKCILASMAGIFLFVGFVSGCYPAFILSSVQPTTILRGTMETGKQGVLFRKILVVAQFAISIILIISTMIFGRQLNFLLSKNLGFKKDGIVVIRNDRSTSRQTLQPLKSELLSDSRVLGVAGSQMLPSSIGMYNTVTWEGALEGREISIMFNRVDYDFLKTFEIGLVAGRQFSPEFPGDMRAESGAGGMENSRSIIINEEAMRQFGWENPIGKKVIESYDEERTHYNVVGVIKDFHFNSLRESIRPLKLFCSTSNNRYISVKIPLKDLDETLKFIKRTWKRHYPDVPFDYFFLDRVFEQTYQAETSLKKLFHYFSGLAVFIGCLGLLGLASYAAERRSKEIGIRKVLGASSQQIVMLLSKDFSRWVLAANIFAWPAAYFAMRSWLGGYAYRINLNSQLVYFFLAGAAALSIALITVAFQSVKAALTDPVKCMKVE